MKNLLLLICILGTFGAQARSSFKATVEYATCGEIDPWYVGDACLFHFKTMSSKRIALVVDLEVVVFEIDVENIVGEVVIIDSTKLNRISNRMKLETLKEYKDGYFYYDADSGAFKVDHGKKSEMAIMLRNMWSYPQISERPLGYTLKPVKIKNFKTNSVFAKFIKNFIKGRMSEYSNYVMHSDEYDHLTYNERIQEYNNVHENFGKYLVEFNEIYRVYKDGEFIGYYIEAHDHLEAEMIQDGAWLEMYLDVNQKVVRFLEESA